MWPSTFIKRFWAAIKLFDERRCLTLAAASSFYLIITTVPLALLMLRVVGIVLGDLVKTEQFFFGLLVKAFPQATPELVTMLRKIIAGPLFGEGGMTLFNIGVLAFTSLGLVNSLWNGIFLITEDKELLSWKNYLSGLVVLLMTAVMLIALFALPPMILWIIAFLSSNGLLDYLSTIIPNFHHVQRWLLWGAGWAELLVRSYWFYSAILVSYFALLYRWLFHQKLRMRVAILAATIFVSGLIFGKWAFALYFSYAKHNLERQYGSYYSFIAALMWVLVVMALFYFGLCVCHIYRQKNRRNWQWKKSLQRLKKNISRLFFRLSFK